MITVTGATGQLGRLVFEALLQRVPAAQLRAAVRSPAKAADLAARGVQVRRADYDDAASLADAFAGTEKLLLISASDPGRRVAQHRAAIDAAKKAGVSFIAYTSVLRADTSPLGLAAEHGETEAMLKASGIPFALLRNGWYTENYAASIPAAVAHGVLMGSAGDGRIATAARADYAAAAAEVVTAPDQAGKVYELAGDSAFTLAEFAAEIARQSGQPVAYQNLPEADYEAALLGFGLPAPLAHLIADSATGASKGGLFDDGRVLSRLIGRPTTPWQQTVRATLAG